MELGAQRSGDAAGAPRDPQQRALDALVEAVLDLYGEDPEWRGDAATSLGEERAAVIDVACAHRWFCLQRLIAPQVGVLARLAAMDGAAVAEEAMAHLALVLRSAEIAGDDDMTLPIGVEAALREALPISARALFDKAPSLGEKLIVASLALAPGRRVRLADRMRDEAALAMRYGRLTWAERRIVRARARSVEG